MRKSCVLALALAAVAAPALAQPGGLNLDWASVIPLLPSPDGYNFGETGLVLDDAGNTFVSGFFIGDFDFDPGPGGVGSSPSSVSTFVVGLGPDGGTRWVDLWFGDDSPSGLVIAWDLAVDPTGNVYVGGGASGAVDFDPGPGEFVLASAGAFLVKLDPEGGFLWAIAIDGASGDAAAVGPSGEVVIAGTYTGTVDADPGPGVFTLPGPSGVFVVWLEPDGSFSRATAIGLGDGSAGLEQCAFDPSGGVRLVGFFDGTVDFDPGPGAHPVTAVGDRDDFVLSLDPGGEFQWVASFGTPAFDSASSVAVDPAGSTYAGSYSLGNFLAVTKMDPSGQVTWRQVVNAPVGALDDVALREDRVVTTGSFQGTSIDFDPGPGQFSMSSLNRAPFVWILSTSGKLVDAGKFVTGANAGARHVMAGPAGQVVVAGRNDGFIDLDPGAGSLPVTNFGGFIVQLRTDHGFVDIPALSQVGLTVMVVLLAGLGAVLLRRS